MARILRYALRRTSRSSANAGGVNPQACSDAVAEVARKLGLAGKVSIGIVAGDDI